MPGADCDSDRIQANVRNYFPYITSLRQNTPRERSYTEYDPRTEKYNLKDLEHAVTIIFSLLFLLKMCKCFFGYIDLTKLKIAHIIYFL